jgi:DNA-binding NtrC family response regulator
MGIPRLPPSPGGSPDTVGKPLIVGRSDALKAICVLAERVASGDAKVLITGESGVGKDLVARHIHSHSRRAAGAFVPVNCAGLTETLLESELFGHVKGSFTDAVRDKVGKLQLANDGTVFLDEVAEMSLRMQALFLRFLENGEIHPVGTDQMRTHVDVRVVAATNKDLPEAVAAGRFREDLMYRLDVVHIHVPPLRDRREDIRAIIEHLVSRANRPISFTEEALKALEVYRWPGNVRELQNVIERAIILSKGSDLQIPLFSTDPQTGYKGTFEDMPTLDELQCRYIKHVFEYTRGRVSGPGGAAEILGMKRTSLYSRMKALGMQK